MTSNEIATRSPLGDRMQYAKALAAASLLPAAYRNQPANVLLAIEYGEALGLAPVAAIQGVHVIDGKPTASAQLIGALVRRAGHRLRVEVNREGTAARATVIRSDDPDFVFESVWTLDRAQAAGLLGKGTWKAYPASMLKARAITEVARDACPEALSGVIYTPEELGHDDEHVIVERVTTPTADDAWTTPEPEAVEVEVVEAELAEAPVMVPNNVTGPLARRWGREEATAKQKQMLGRLVREAGFDDTADLLDSPEAVAILGGRPSSPLNKGHASQLIDALTSWRDDDAPAPEPEADSQELGEAYEEGRK